MGIARYNTHRPHKTRPDPCRERDQSCFTVDSLFGPPRTLLLIADRPRYVDEGVR